MEGATGLSTRRRSSPRSPITLALNCNRSDDHIEQRTRADVVNQAR